MLNMVKKSIFESLVILAVCLAFSSVSFAGGKIKINSSSVVSPESIFYKYFFKDPAELMESATDNRLKIKIYPSGSLVAFHDTYQSLQTGILGFNYIWDAMTPGAFPLHSLFSLPGLFPNQATSNKVLNALYAKYPQFDKETHPDVHRVSTQVHMRADIHSRVPIRSLADLKGKVISCQNPEVASALKKLGASVSVMKNSEIYTSLERKVVDGVVIAWGTVSGLRLYEIAKYHTIVGLCPGTSHFLFNRKVWNKFTPEEQERISHMAPALQSSILVGNVDMSMDVRFDKAIPEKGHEIIYWSEEDMTKMKELFKPIWDKWAEDMTKLGHPGKDMLKDAIQLIDAYTLG